MHASVCMGHVQVSFITCMYVNKAKKFYSTMRSAHTSPGAHAAHTASENSVVVESNKKSPCRSAYSSVFAFQNAAFAAATFSHARVVSNVHCMPCEYAVELQLTPL